MPSKITNISGFFYGNHVTNFAKIYVPNDSVEKYRNAAVWKDYKDSVLPFERVSSVILAKGFNVVYYMS